MDKGSENEAFGGPSYVEKLWRPDLPTAIWEVLDAYSDVFPFVTFICNEVVLSLQ